MLVCQKSNVSAYDKCLALRKSWLVMVNISDKDVYVETDSGIVDVNKLRSCYPESKRSVEVLTRCYVDEYNVKDLVFSSDEEMQKQIDVVNKDLDLDDISKIIKDSVKTSAASEILRAKKEKEDIKQLEADLVNDMNVKNEEDIQEAMQLRGFGETKTFQPSLFQGIMIGNMNKFTKMEESGLLEPDYIYNTLEDYGYNESTNDTGASKEELAFIETVKEYTRLSIVKALKMERFSLNDINDLANQYAYNSEFVV